MSETTHRKHGNGSPDPVADLRSDLERLRGLNRGAGDGGDRRGSVWRRSTDAVLGRAPDDQRPFNDGVIDVLESWLRRLDETAAVGARLEARVQELTAARDHLAGRVDDETLRRREKDAESERRGRLSRKQLDALQAAQEQLSERLESLGSRVDEAVSRHEESARRTLARGRERDKKVQAELETFRGEVARILQAGENIRLSLIDAARRITAVERHETVLEDLHPRLEKLEEGLVADRAQSAEQETALQRETERRAVLEAGLLALGKRLDAVHRAAEGAAAAEDAARALSASVQEQLSAVDERIAGAIQEAAGLRGALGHFDEDRRSVTKRLEQLESNAEVDLPAGPRVPEADDSATASSRAGAAEILARAGVASRGTVLQIGVTRGRFLEACREVRLPARGVDRDPAMEARGHALGLDVVAGDPLSYLQSLEPGSLGAVYSAHLVETLSPPALSRLLAEVPRVLAPGGTLVLDALNPASLTVLADFYRDPARRRPVHAETVAFLMQAAGFATITVQRAGPPPDEVKLPEVPSGPWCAPGLEPLRAGLNRQVRALNALLFGHRVQRVVATRPEDAGR